MKFKVGDEVVCVNIEDIEGQTHNWAIGDELKEGETYKVIEIDADIKCVRLEGFYYWHNNVRFQLAHPIAHLSQQGAQC